MLLRSSRKRTRTTTARWRDGTAGSPFLRDVDENAEDAPVGTPLSASDDHGGAVELIFTHGGADKDSFEINRDDGQLSVDERVGLRGAERVHGDL